MNYLAFDLGGSSGKLFLSELKNNRLTLTPVHQFKNRPVSMGNGLYWDFIHIYQELISGIRKAVAQTEDTIDSIGFDSFCNDFALIDETGNLLTPVRCYRDSRTARCQEHTYSIMSREELYKINGNQSALFNTLLQLDAMETEGQGWLLDNCYKALFLSDLLIFWLTGKAVTEYTTASVTQMFDFIKNDWSETILKNYKIRKSLFAPLVFPGTVIGRTSDSFNKDLKTKGFFVSSVCHHDTACAFLSSVCPRHCAIISCGTWSLVGTETAYPIITEEGFLSNIANEGGYAGHHRLLRNVMGTWIIQEILHQLNHSEEAYTYSRLDSEAGNCTTLDCFIDADAEIFYQPENMIEKIHSFCMEHYQTAPRTTGELIFCVYASLAFKYRLAIEKLEQITQTPLPVINIVGGGSQSSLMCQLTSNICRRPVAAGPADASALGNILVQMIASGTISSVSEGRRLIKNSFPVKHYKPDVSSHWEKLYQDFILKFHF
ncbi:Rhamnulokinase [uncultured Roseburia sp.]|uniref:Rhamnulokinase n=1 Tax=Brotonthovivens ammoniilytica TaxID=2981725 RepID=A0ABT2TKP8_9FIRM|nr:rhamnulokinase family protein [Brotonthovivens ammoniilytica]MCU6762789.1 rhamnulokinase [Brotonthovivens ammoniilytica]SCI88989.1 Rhamnulokinase [uncultured Roseburia sp.]